MDCSVLFLTCQALKAWFKLSRVNLHVFRNDLKGKKITSTKWEDRDEVTEGKITVEPLQGTGEICSLN